MSIQKLAAHRLLGLTLAAILFATGIAGCSSAPVAQPAAAPADTQQQVAQPAINEKITPADYQAEFVSSEAPHLLLDVRTRPEFASGHIPGAMNIPVQELSSRLNEVPQDQPVVVYCRSGNRSAQAAQILGNADYSQVYDLGGIASWVDQGYPVE